jgi:hypothetical protein
VTEASSYFRGCVAVLPALATKVLARASNCALMATMIVLADMRTSDLNSNNTRFVNHVLVRDCCILWILASVAAPFFNKGDCVNPESLRRFVE